MFGAKHLLYIHIILVYFTLIYSQGYLSMYRLVRASGAETTTPVASDDMTEDQIKNIKREYKALAMQRLFDIKGKPDKELPKDPDTKLFVPSAMLKQYIGYRDEVREVVPDDRDFYGRINIDAVGSHENMWTANIGDYDVEVNLPRDERPDSETLRGEDASHIAHLPLASEPEELPPNVAHALPPFDAKYETVLLKYNLSQEIYASPTAAIDFKRAELRLTREKLNYCDFHDCVKRTKSTLTSYDNRSRTGQQDDDEADELPEVPQFQHVYILIVNGYDEFGDPIAAVIKRARVDTHKTAPLVFDISDQVRGWLKNPKTNHGLIVRVANEDQEKINPRPRMQTSKRDTNSSAVDSSQYGIDNYAPETGVLEHVRLRRAFRSKSDSYEIWRDKQPAIIIWSKIGSTEPVRHHVKRHNSEHETMQADEPDPTTTVDPQSSTIAQIPSSEMKQGSHTEKTPSVNAPSLHGKRDHMPTANISSSRRAGPNSRAPNGGRPSSQQGSRPKSKSRPTIKQTDKCSKRPLNINFDEVGWSSWIIAPHSYYANYCSGDCNWPLSDTQNSTNHAIIQSIYRSVGRVVPKSCCAPVKLGRMAILYQLDGIVQMRLYDDMIVEACGCL